MTNSNDLMEAMEIMARAVSAHANCKYKYDRLRIEFPKLDLPRFSAAPSARLSDLSFECDRAFPA